MQAGAVVAMGLIAAVGGGIAWLAVRGRRLQRQAHFDRTVRARKLGWRYDGTRDGRIDYRFAGGGDGIDWTMWYDSDRGDDSPTPSAHWHSDNLRTESLSLVILGRRRYALENGAVGRLLMGVVSGVANALGGDDSVADKLPLYEQGVLLERGRPSFNERFVVVMAADMPRDWLDDVTEENLLSWPASEGVGAFRPEDAVEIGLGPRGLSIAVQKMPDRMAHWQHLADLGEHLARRLAAARA